MKGIFVGLIAIVFFKLPGLVTYRPRLVLISTIGRSLQVYFYNKSIKQNLAGGDIHAMSASIFT